MFFGGFEGFLRFWGNFECFLGVLRGFLGFWGVKGV